MVVENLFSDLSIWVNRPKFLVLEVIYSVQMRYLGWLPDQIIGPDFQSLVKLWYWTFKIAVKVLESFSCLNTEWSNLNWTILEIAKFQFGKLWWSRVLQAIKADRVTTSHFRFSKCQFLIWTPCRMRSSCPSCYISFQINAGKRSLQCQKSWKR